MEIFVESVLQDNVKVHPRYLDKYIEQHIEEVLKTKYEAKCSKFGFIVPNSIKVVNLEEGFVETHSFHGFVIFKTHFSARLCNPTENSVISSRVVNMNSFGLLCAAGYADDASKEYYVDIIIPRQVKNAVHQSASIIDSLCVNDTAYVEIIGKKYQFNSKRICTFGRIVDQEPRPRVELDDELNLDNTGANSDSGDDLESLSPEYEEEAESARSIAAETNDDESEVDEADAYDFDPESDTNDTFEDDDYDDNGDKS